MTETLENCLTCWRKTDSFLRVSDEINDEGVGTIVASHFWFQIQEYEDRVLCTSCWEKIEDFHKFYCEVKHVWNYENLSKSSVIKKERSFDGVELEEDLFTNELVKVEITKNEHLEIEIPCDNKEEDGRVLIKNSHQPEQQTDSSDDSEKDSMVPIAKRFRRAKIKTAAMKRQIRKKQRVRSQQKHKTTNRNKYGTSLHCDLCDPVRSFKDEVGLQLHKTVYHPEQSEKKFQCDQCEKAFASEWQLSCHRNFHQNIESLNIHCNICNKYFDSARTLNNHIRACHPESMAALSIPPFGSITNDTANVSADQLLVEVSVKTSQRQKTSEAEHAEQDELIRKYCTLVCDLCGFMGENFYNLEKHYKSEHDMRGYAGCCNRRFYKKRQLYEHCQRHVNPDIFRCELCKKSFTEKDGLEKHNQWVHTPDSEKPFKCDICDAAFFKEYLLRNHMKYHLSMEQKVYNCEECDRSFGAPSYLKTHQQTVHGAASSWVCDICAKGFPHKSSLETHRLGHTKEGAASLKKQCEHCNKWLKNESSFKRHVRRCMASGPATCDICGKQVANEMSLASHKRFYHTEQPSFTCSYCGKQFRRIIRHKEHEANHRGEVLYSCPFCAYTCNSNSNMYTHKKVAHPDLWAAKIADRFYKR
ncbi:zinc finger protein 91-like isoform X2 [Armigeres subalbatus]|uniref:zinc finger protein 91-like isoform X2 n=1 Tax=Armigeres subalbatus TaxID=124917 RepID=UPI002ECFADBC